MAQSVIFAQPATRQESCADIVQVVQHPVPECPNDKVLVKMSAAPINSLDILVLQDKYFVKPKNSVADRGVVPGYDGFGHIVAVGADVKDTAIGNAVIVARHGLGTWRTHLIVDTDDLLNVAAETPPEFGALLRMGATPAYFLLEDNGKHLQPGDWIIQNAATGVITHFVAQLARLRGFNVISVVRDRSDMETTKMSLQSHGASMVISEADLDNDDIFAGKKIMLGLDAVFGSLAERMAKRLSSKAVFCSYGFLSGLSAEAHIRVTPGLVWANQITFQGFRLSVKLGSLSKTSQQELMQWLVKLAARGQITMPFIESFVWEGSINEIQLKIREAIRASASNSVGTKKWIIRFEA